MKNPDTPDNPTSNQDATIDENERQIVPKLLIAPIAILIATMMIGLPVLRIFTDEDDTSLRSQAATEARGQVAVRFASAVLESRSTSIASRYAVDDIHEGIRAVINDLRQREPEELRGTVARTSRITCASDDQDRECFTARLARPGEDPVTELTFVVGIVDGSARVVALGNPETALLSGSRWRW